MKLRRALLYVLLGFGITLVAYLAVAQQKPAQTATPAASSSPSPLPAPPIPADHRAEFFKRQLALNQAQQAMTAAQTAFQSAVQQLTKDCGERFLPQIDPQGDPACVAKTTPSVTPKKGSQP